MIVPLSRSFLSPTTSPSTNSKPECLSRKRGLSYTSITLVSNTQVHTYITDPPRELIVLEFPSQKLRDCRYYQYLVSVSNIRIGGENSFLPRNRLLQSRHGSRHPVQPSIVRNSTHGAPRQFGIRAVPNLPKLNSKSNLTEQGKLNRGFKTSA